MCFFVMCLFLHQNVSKNLENGSCSNTLERPDPSLYHTCLENDFFRPQAPPLSFKIWIVGTQGLSFNNLHLVQLSKN